jgi:hypothetical protein
MDNKKHVVYGIESAAGKYLSTVFIQGSANVWVSKTTVEPVL